MVDLSKKITVIIKTFERPKMINRAISSFRSIHQTIPVIVADDSKNPVSFNDDDHTLCLHLPFDTGLSYGRNRAIEKVNTPYYLLIDDDHYFKEDCNLDELVDVLDNTNFDIVGMRMMNYYSTKRHYCLGEFHYAGILVQGANEISHYIGKNNGYSQGYPIYDIVLNCFLAKTDRMRKISYDENIKIGFEHVDYFLEAKKAELLITQSRNSYIHHCHEHSDHYKNFRQRSRKYEHYYFKKHNLKSVQVIGDNYGRFNKIRYFPHRIANRTSRLSESVRKRLSGVWNN